MPREIFVWQFFIILLVSQYSTNGLSCFESTINEYGDTAVQVVSDNSWTVCVITYMLDNRVPMTSDNGSLFGLGPDSEDLSEVERLLATGSGNAVEGENTYKIKQVCIFEQYDFRQVKRYRRSLSLLMMSNDNVENVFRCFCNSDLCNSENKFERNLQAMGGNK